MKYDVDLVCDTKTDPDGYPYMPDTLNTRALGGWILVTAVDAGETTQRNSVYRLFWSHA